MAKRFRQRRFSFAPSFAAAAVAFLLMFPVGAFLFLFLWAELFGVDGCRLRTGGLPRLVVFAAYVTVTFLFAYVPAHLIFTHMRWRTIEDDGPRCGACDYNLTGNTSGICPECGEPIAAQE